MKKFAPLLILSLAGCYAQSAEESARVNAVLERALRDQTSGMLESGLVSVSCGSKGASTNWDHVYYETRSGYSGVNKKLKVSALVGLKQTSITVSISGTGELKVTADQLEPSKYSLETATGMGTACIETGNHLARIQQNRSSDRPNTGDSWLETPSSHDRPGVRTPSVLEGRF